QKLTPALIKQINEVETLTELEDIYLPYKPKRKTRASIARDKGLQALADQLLQQEKIDPIKSAADFINLENGVLTADEALLGARDILAELFSENAVLRSKIRELFHEAGSFKSILIAD